MTAKRDPLQNELKARELQAENTSAALTQRMDNLNQQLAAMTAQRDSLHNELKARESQAKDKVASLTQSMDNLNHQLAAMTTQRDSLQNELKSRKLQIMRIGRLDSLNKKQSYASGLKLSENVLNSVYMQTDLGIGNDPEIILEGFADGIHKSAQMDNKISKKYAKLFSDKLSSLVMKKYKAGQKVMEGLTRKNLVKRNGTFFFTRTGLSNKKKEVKKGEMVTFDMTESLINGHYSHAQKNISLRFNEHLPYIISQALTLSGRKGAMTVYCFASDVYPSGGTPSGVFGYSVLKFDFKVH